MQIEALAGMIFSFLMTVTLILSIGGIILLKPLMKHLGNYLEARAEERQILAERIPDDSERVLRAMERLEERLETLEERQEFMERLLMKPDAESRME